MPTDWTRRIPDPRYCFGVNNDEDILQQGDDKLSVGREWTEIKHNTLFSLGRGKNTVTQIREIAQTLKNRKNFQTS